jgi:hypothetical protein
MSGYRTGNAEAEAAKLKQRFRSVTRRVEWRHRLREAGWWTTVCAIATIGAFAGMTLLWLSIPE